MILKIDAATSLTALFVFLLISYPLLFDTYDLSGLKELRDRCSATLETVRNMPFIVHPEGNPATMELYVAGAALDTVYVNGTMRWSVRVGCGG